MSRSAGLRAVAARQTWAISGRPPSLCSTLAVRERIRVPNPAASINTSSGAGVSCKVICGCFSIECKTLDGERLFSTPLLRAAGDDHARQLLGIVTDFLALVQQVCPHDLGFTAKGLFQQVVLHAYLVCAVGAVARGLLLCDRTIVGDDVIEADLRRV